MAPDVILMDINLPKMNGIECVRQLKALIPSAQILMLTVYEDSDKIFNSLLAGASGYLLKRTPQTEILEAIADVHRGNSPMTGHIARKVVQFFNQRGSPEPKWRNSQIGSGKCWSIWPGAFPTRKSPVCSSVSIDTVRVAYQGHLRQAPCPLAGRGRGQVSGSLSPPLRLWGS